MIREAQQEQQLSSLAAGPWVEDVGFGTQKGGKHGWEIPKYMSMFIGKNYHLYMITGGKFQLFMKHIYQHVCGKTNLNNSWVHTSMFVGWNHVLLASIVLTCKSSFSDGKTLSCWWKESQGLGHQFIMDSNVHADFFFSSTLYPHLYPSIYPHTILMLSCCCWSQSQVHHFVPKNHLIIPYRIPHIVVSPIWSPLVDHEVNY